MHTNSLEPVETEVEKPDSASILNETSGRAPLGLQ